MDARVTALDRHLQMSNPLPDGSHLLWCPVRIVVKVQRAAAPVVVFRMRVVILRVELLATKTTSTERRPRKPPVVDRLRLLGIQFPRDMATGRMHLLPVPKQSSPLQTALHNKRAISRVGSRCCTWNCAFGAKVVNRRAQFLGFSMFYEGISEFRLYILVQSPPGRQGVAGARRCDQVGVGKWLWAFARSGGLLNSGPATRWL